MHITQYIAWTRAHDAAVLVFVLFGFDRTWACVSVSVCGCGCGWIRHCSVHCVRIFVGTHCKLVDDLNQFLLEVVVCVFHSVDLHTCSAVVSRIRPYLGDRNFGARCFCLSLPKSVLSGREPFGSLKSSSPLFERQVYFYIGHKSRTKRVNSSRSNFRYYVYRYHQLPRKQSIMRTNQLQCHVNRKHA